MSAQLQHPQLLSAYSRPNLKKTHLVQILHDKNLFAEVGFKCNFGHFPPVGSIDHTGRFPLLANAAHKTTEVIQPPLQITITYPSIQSLLVDIKLQMEITVKPLIAKNYIIVPKEQTLLECSICYDKAVELMRCSGPCSQPFCLVCLSNIKRRGKGCPSRCSKTLVGVPITEHKVAFECPYNPQLCSPLVSVQQFKAHILKCPHMKEQDKQQVANKKAFKCIKSHELTYLNQFSFQELFPSQDYYEFTQKQYCVICHEQRITNTICTLCEPDKKNQFYCLECRSIPFSKYGCKYSHQLEIDEDVDDYETLCDFCGASVLLFEKYCYEDTFCDFDICVRCYEAMPDKLENALPRNTYQSIPMSMDSSDSD